MEGGIKRKGRKGGGRMENEGLKERKEKEIKVKAERKQRQ